MARSIIGADDRTAAHLAVADYFGAQEEMTPRKAAEWPWQLHAAEAWGACYTEAYRQWIEAPANAADHFVPAELGYFLLENGIYPVADPLLRRALEAQERVLGPEHPDTLLSVNNLAVLLDSKGDYAGALPLYERALEGLLKVSRAIGRPHPNLQTCKNNYADCLVKLGHSREQIFETLRPVRVAPTGPG